MTMTARRAAAVSALVYIVLTAAMFRQVLGGLTLEIASDPGDPLLVASLLAWNATHLPFSDAWWQFPSFFPIRDTLAFSEHLLGVSVISTPLYWLTGNAVATYNLTLLLTYPLSGMAMYALAYALTRRSAVAFLAGLAFAFAPYRVSQLPHLQMLVVFWIPVALLGLHVWLETERRGPLLLAAAAWMLQAMSNAYMLVLLSVLIAGWVAWFVIAQRRWRPFLELAAVFGTAIALLAPLLYRYATVHEENGFSRGLGEATFYGADLAAPLCAPPQSTFWGWLQVSCAPEGHLFAGAGLIGVCMLGAITAWRHAPAAWGTARSPRVLRLVRQALLAAAIAYAGIVVSVLVLGPLRVDLGFVRASASTAVKPFSTAVALLLGALLLSPRLRAMVRSRSAPAFYALAGIAAVVLAWGPAPKLFGRSLIYMAPYRWLMAIPGGDGLRVPARFWVITLTCAILVASFTLAAWLQGRRPRRTALVVVFLAGVFVADGWTTVSTATAPGPAPDPAALRGGVVLELPIGEVGGDIAAQYRAVLGGWTTVNGYSGYEAAHYHALRLAERSRKPLVFAPFRARDDLHVLVSAASADLQAFVERQRGAAVVGRNATLVQYRLPREGRFDLDEPAGAPLPLASVSATVSPEDVGYVADRNLRSVWHAPQDRDASVTIELEGNSTVGAVVFALGSYHANFPRRLVVETSLDGGVWEAGWDGEVLEHVVRAAFARPDRMDVVVAFEARRARFVRLRQVGRDTEYQWSIAELGVRPGR